MLNTRDTFAQGKFIQNYNQIVAFLIELAIYKKDALMDAKGVCAGLCKVYILKDHEERNDEFYSAIEKITALSSDDFEEIRQLLIPLIKSPIHLSAKNKLAFMADIFQQSSFSNVKRLTYTLFNFIDLIQKTQQDNENSNFLSIAGNWDDTFSLCCFNSDLTNLFKHYLSQDTVSDVIENQTESKEVEIKKNRHYFCSLLGESGSHAFVIKRNKDGTFVVYDPNADEREDHIILNNLDTLKDRIIRVIKEIDFDARTINMTAQPVSFGETYKNNILSEIFRNDHSLFQIFPALSDLRNHFLHNDVSDSELIRLLQDCFSVDQNIKLTDDQLETLNDWQLMINKFLPFTFPKLLLVTDELLTLAIKDNEITLIKYLLKTGFDVNHKNIEGLSMLHTAIIQCRPEIVKYIINDPTINLNQLLINNNNPEGIPYLEYAIFRGVLSKNQKEVESYKTIINQLIEKGAILQPSYFLHLEVLRENNKNNPFASEILNFIDMKFPHERIETIELNPNLLLTASIKDAPIFLDEKEELTLKEKFDRLISLKLSISSTVFFVKNWLGNVVEGAPDTIKTISSDLNNLHATYQAEDNHLIENLFEKTCRLLSENLKKPSGSRLESTTKFYQDEYEELTKPPKRQHRADFQ